MSMFLSKCVSCGYSIVKDSACSNCGHLDSCSDKEEGTIEEFARRKALHDKNSAILFNFKLIGGSCGVMVLMVALWLRATRFSRRSMNRLEFQADTIESGSANFDGFIMLGIFFVVTVAIVAIYHRFIERSETLLPVALNCPKCEARLDTLNIAYSQCPSCNVLLQASGIN